MSFTIVNGTLKKYEGDDVTVVIPEGVRSIDDYAFYGASAIRRVIIPASAEDIGNNVFYDCEQLEEAVVPDTVRWMGSAVFSRCKNLRSVTLPEGLTKLPNITFYQCTGLADVKLPPRLTRIGRAAFEQCASLKTLDLPVTLKVIEEKVFDACVSLSSVTLPEGIEEIGDNAFYQCAALRSVNLPSSLKSIGKGALETRGKISIESGGDLLVRSRMLDNNWNMYWNFGSNGRYNGKNEDNYQLVSSWLPHVDLKEWKPLAQCVLAVNYLETYRYRVDFYEEWIRDHAETVMAECVRLKRWQALNTALGKGLIPALAAEKWLDKIRDPQERAVLLEFRKKEKEADIFDLLGEDDGWMKS